MLRTLAAAVAITALHTAVAAALSGQPDAGSAWLALHQQDGDWFQTVVEFGYHVPSPPTKTHPGNVAFFPAYPLAARGVMAATGLPPKPALLLAAQLACVGFWTYFLLLLGRWGTPPAAKAACVGLMAGHPAAFFLVSSYSESTFLFALGGFVYWSGRTGAGQAGADVLAALHGFVMTAARLVGVPCVAYPLLLAWARRATAGGYATALAAGAISLLGAGGFAAFLHAEFGRWDAFAVSHTTGWGVRPDPLAFFRLKTWALRYGEALTVWRDVAALDRLFVPLTALHFVLLGAMEWRARRGGHRTRWRDRLPLYAVAFALFAVPVVSHSTRGLSSLTRFALCWDAVLVLALAGLMADRPDWARKRWVLAALIGGAAWFLSVQVALAAKFTRGEFVG